MCNLIIPQVVREQPPCKPVPAAEINVQLPARLAPLPPRRVVIERLPPMPPKPVDFIIERWLPYEEQERQIKFIKSEKKVRDRIVRAKGLRSLLCILWVDVKVLRKQNTFHWFIFDFCSEADISPQKIVYIGSRSRLWTQNQSQKQFRIGIEINKRLKFLTPISFWV